MAEFTNATTTQCFHPQQRHWSIELLDKLQLPHHFLPPVVMPGTVLGTLLSDVQSATGLGSIHIVAPATHDTASAVAAVPTTFTGQANWAYISSGTWSLMGVEVPDAILHPDVLTHNFTNEGGVDHTYRLLKNIMGLWIVQEMKRAWSAMGKEYSYAELTTLAHQAASTHSIIDVDDARFFRSGNMPQLVQEYCAATQQLIPETPGELVRCALESLAQKYKTVLGQLEQLTGEPIDLIHVVGGGARNALLNQLTANACQRPVVAGPVEATAIGNVLVQARADGAFTTLAELRQVVATSFSDEMTTYLPIYSPT
jgi:rhamnulokinase